MPIGKSWMPMGGGKAKYRPPSVTSRMTRSGGRAILGKGWEPLPRVPAGLSFRPILKNVTRSSCSKKCAKSHKIEGVHTLTLQLIKEKIRRNLRRYPSTLGWARRIGRVFGLTSRIDIDYIFDLANRRGRDVFFLQVGANDGLMDDPIHFLVRKYGWCGVLLEPDPQLFKRLKEN